MTPESQINDYLAQLRSSLKGMTVTEREDIVEEIHMHIRERLADPHASLDSVLNGLGPASELAQQYCTGVLVQRAPTQHLSGGDFACRPALGDHWRGRLHSIRDCANWLFWWRRISFARADQAILPREHRFLGRSRSVQLQLPNGRHHDKSGLTGSRSDGLVAYSSVPDDRFAQSCPDDEAVAVPDGPLSLESAVHRNRARPARDDGVLAWIRKLMGRGLVMASASSSGAPGSPAIPGAPS